MTWQGFGSRQLLDICNYYFFDYSRPTVSLRTIIFCSSLVASAHCYKLAEDLKLDLGGSRRPYQIFQRELTYSMNGMVAETINVFVHYSERTKSLETHSKMKTVPCDQGLAALPLNVAQHNWSSRTAYCSDQCGRHPGSSTHSSRL